MLVLLIFSEYCMDARFDIVLKSNPDSNAEYLIGQVAQINILVIFSSRKHRKFVQTKISCWHLCIPVSAEHMFNISFAEYHCQGKDII